MSAAQPFLWDTIPTPTRRPCPYQRGSDTSRAAAEAIAPHALTLRERYLAFLVECGASGATDEEAALAIPMKRQTICPRRRELMQEDPPLVKDSKRRRGGCAVFVTT